MGAEGENGVSHSAKCSEGQTNSHSDKFAGNKTARTAAAAAKHQPDCRLLHPAVCPRVLSRSPCRPSVRLTPRFPVLAVRQNDDSLSRFSSRFLRALSGHRHESRIREEERSEVVGEGKAAMEPRYGGTGITPKEHLSSLRAGRGVDERTRRGGGHTGEEQSLDPRGSAGGGQRGRAAQHPSSMNTIL